MYFNLVEAAEVVQVSITSTTIPVAVQTKYKQPTVNISNIYKATDIPLQSLNWTMGDIAVSTDSPIELVPKKFLNNKNISTTPSTILTNIQQSFISNNVSIGVNKIFQSSIPIKLYAKRSLQEYNTSIYYTSTNNTSGIPNIVNKYLINNSTYTNTINRALITIPQQYNNSKYYTSIVNISGIPILPKQYLTTTSIFNNKLSYSCNNTFATSSKQYNIITYTIAINNSNNTELIKNKFLSNKITSTKSLISKTSIYSRPVYVNRYPINSKYSVTKVRIIDQTSTGQSNTYKISNIFTYITNDTIPNKGSKYTYSILPRFTGYSNTISTIEVPNKGTLTPYMLSEVTSYVNSDVVIPNKGTEYIYTPSKTYQSIVSIAEISNKGISIPFKESKVYSYINTYHNTSIFSSMYSSNTINVNSTDYSVKLYSRIQNPVEIQSVSTTIGIGINKTYNDSLVSTKTTRYMPIDHVINKYATSKIPIVIINRTNQPVIDASIGKSGGISEYWS